MYSSPITTKVKNESSYTSTYPVCLHSIERDFMYLCGADMKWPNANKPKQFCMFVTQQKEGVS